ncbi:2,4-dienoyl-CoA reductase-like NADH-dependent reductase (Old Yellow Enzyme family) [Methylorubrum rhodinum]|uniref:2,4-dienoyl-CoA reductase-like NADH-dependent reductase (Old Yellow Enzyme family) n=1 Tax=Methylorubrum rhodinum TaxID=29428 RepID=A0A840ZJI4_9HYPH|nr:NADH:flavin oxidoreductase/NADH oxidase [Methylorubrum rhodinum]MBB5757107.1 2,4-dienoyl-CoA reductase-like NADH-dependent reductase (Old Yellow Enzyme family) [Methylorubrum rhodinum]
MPARLFEPFRLDDLELENRIVIAPMCQYSARGGAATDWHLTHLGQLAQSGAGLLTLEATAIAPEARISPADLGLYDDATERALARVLDAIREYAPIPVAIQINHAGRKASSRVPWEGGAQIAPDAPDGWRTEAPSPLAHGEGEVAPHALDAEGLKRVRDGFVATAKLALRLGIDGFEIHGAHGYLLHQFLSPLSNRREDQYGGSLENRMRFPLEVFEAVREAVPSGKPVWMRVSATDWVEEGWDLDQTVELARALKARGSAAIHVSTGGLSPAQKIPLGPGYQVPFAERIKAETGLTTIAVGLITEPAQAEAILAEGKADAVSLARAMLYDPRWPWHAAAELGGRVRAPKQYWRSQPREYKDLFKDAAHGQR